MFGWFRFVAALAVVMTHIGGVEFVAGVAVWGFFMLSGFLMTAVLNGRYGLTGEGISTFALSRAWRLFPSYWASLLLSALVISIGADSLAPEVFNPALSMPHTFREWFAGIFIIGHTTFGMGRVDRALSPSAWAVDVEILMYACSCILLARGERLARASMVVLLAGFVGLWFVARRFVAAGELDVASQLLYSFLPAALLPYIIGTLLWFARERLWGQLRSVAAFLLGCVGLLVSTLFLFPRSVTLAYLATLPCLALILAYLLSCTGSKRQRSVDEYVGRMAYPIYLIHWLGGYLVGLMTQPGGAFYSIVDGRAHFSVAGVLLVTVIVVALSAILASFVEAPIDRARNLWLKRRKLASA